MGMYRYLYFLSCSSAISLIFLGVFWELLLSPLRPGGSWLVLKIFPILVALPGLLKKKKYTYQWASMASMLYLAEGIVRSSTEQGLNKNLAMLEIFVTSVFFLSTIFFVRSKR
tara:strand:- start:236 stop:574 length:339 start_codon:yes stop_codon:yes gene_type:complete